MSDIAIKIEGLSKRYRIGQQERYRALRDVITDAAVAPFRRLRSAISNNGHPSSHHSSLITHHSDRPDHIWALDDVSFEVKRGEVVGIIGRNGAGKTTLLKILSRITKPTRGHAEIHGRVGSLLEVGTGFHPELTGRENIYLNGAILGMRKAEIERKFDEIVAFAEVEKFIDTPVKRYSSGMYVRLAFAVAAHLDPEILVVDEVLAVGDASFQKKCLGKMGEVAKGGRTVLFVSHNMIAVQSLCRRAVWLDRGKVVEDGVSGAVVNNYLKASVRGIGLSEEVWNDIAAAPGNDVVRLYRVRIRRQDGSPGSLTMKTPFLIEVEYWNLQPDAELHITLHLYTEQDIIAFTTGSASGSASDAAWLDRRMPVGLFRCVCYVPGELLNAGRHRFAVLVVKDKTSVVYWHESAVSFEIRDLQERQAGWYGREPGVVQPVLKWSTEYLGGSPDIMFERRNLYDGSDQL